MSIHHIRAWTLGRVLFSLLLGWFTLTWRGTVAQAQPPTNLNITDFGAVGDAEWFFANTTSNSPIATTTNQLSTADIGKVIALFGAGPLGTSTIHQDFLATITNVENSTNIYMSSIAGATADGCQGVYGHDNTASFQAC